MGKRLVFLLTMLFIVTIIPIVHADDAQPEDLPKGLVISADLVVDTLEAYQLSKDASIHYYIDGQIYKTGALFRQNDRILIPLRIVAEAFGTADWYNNTKQVTITRVQIRSLLL